MEFELRLPNCRDMVFDMHLGGSHIGIFLAMAIPCAIVSVFHSNTWFKGISILTLVLAGYCLVACFARAALGITALAIVLLVLLGSLSLLHRVHRPRASLLLGSGVLFVLVWRHYTFCRRAFDLFEERFRAVSADWNVRYSTWESAISSLSGGQWLVGKGSGVFPRAQLDGDSRELMPTNYFLVPMKTLRFCESSATRTSTLDKSFGWSPVSNYSLIVRWRAVSPNAQLTVALCEKMLLNSLTCHKLQPIGSESLSQDWISTGSNCSGDHPLVVSRFSACTTRHIPLACIDW